MRIHTIDFRTGLKERHVVLDTTNTVGSKGGGVRRKEAKQNCVVLHGRFVNLVYLVAKTKRVCVSGRKN